MGVILDAEMEYSFYPSLERAQRRAMAEGADTGGLIFTVRSIQIHESFLVLVGTVPRLALGVESTIDRDRPRIRPRALGKFHTTWGALMRPDDTLGFFVIRQPVSFAGRLPPDEDEKDVVSVALQVKRCFKALPIGLLGPRCCIHCNQAIPERRLKAIPGTRTCSICQHKKEVAKNESNFQRIGD